MENKSEDAAINYTVAARRLEDLLAKLSTAPFQYPSPADLGMRFKAAMHEQIADDFIQYGLKQLGLQTKETARLLEAAMTADGYAERKRCLKDLFTYIRHSVDRFKEGVYAAGFGKIWEEYEVD